MELGNMIFGNSRGEVHMKRGGGYEEELHRLFEVIEPGNSYGPEFENATFAIRPYYWGDCSCGFDQKDIEWSESHRHGPNCYQTELHQRMAKYDHDSGYAEIDKKMRGGDDFLFAGMDTTTEKTEFMGVPVTTMISMPRKDAVMEEWRAADAKRAKVEDALYKELCRKYRLPSQGCAVHCTCSHDTDYEKWREANNHEKDCLLVVPNFLYKPSGYSIKWYKYPLRDSYASHKISLRKFCEMIDACIQSVAH